MVDKMKEARTKGLKNIPKEAHHDVLKPRRKRWIDVGEAYFETSQRVKPIWSINCI